MIEIKLIFFFQMILHILHLGITFINSILSERVQRHHNRKKDPNYFGNLNLDNHLQHPQIY